MLRRFILLTFVYLFVAPISNAQTIISKFTWNGGPVSVAAVGPNATSVSSSAVSSIDGTSGTNGLNAGLPKLDVAMVIPGSPTFDVNGIDVSFDYQREESVGDFWSRGSSLIISGCNALSVSYRVSNGAGGFITVNSGNVYNIPNDDVFRRYRFIYLPTSGFGYLMVNGVVVWSNDGPDNRNMYWTGAGNVIVGNLMDGNGANKTFLDSLVVGSVVFSALPVELLDYSISQTADQKVLNTWSTASETNNDYFTVERSTDGKTWREIATISGQGNSTSLKEYFYLDEFPLNGISYYRLTQTDFDGKSEAFLIKSIQLELLTNASVYPNPSKDFCYLDIELENSLKLISANGVDCTNHIEIIQSNGRVQLNVATLPEGVYYVLAGEKRYKILKMNE